MSHHEGWGEKSNEETLSLISDLLECKEIKNLLEDCIEGLPTRERQVIRLRYWSNMDFYEISSCLNMRVATVEKLLHSALRRLRMKRQLILTEYERTKEE